MKIEIKKINSDVFLQLYGGKSPLADYYVRRLKDTDGILSAFADSEPVEPVEPLGYIIYHACGKGSAVSVTVRYIFVSELYRRLGIAGKMLSAVENLFGGRVTVQISISEKISGFDYLHNFFTGNGYAVDNKMYLFRSEKSDFPRWDKYMEKHGNRLMRWLTEVEGYKALSLSEVSEDIINAIRESEMHSKEPYLITPFLNGTQNDFIPSMSFIALKQDSNIPVAHCIVTGPDAVSAVFSQVSASEKERQEGQKGAIFLPLIMSIQRCKEYGYTRSVYAVSEKNTAMMAFANNVLSRITSHKTIQYNFMKVVGDNRNGNE